VKIKLLFMALILLIVLALGCSKDHEPPTFSKYSVTSKPTGVVATYNLEAKTVGVAWDMSNTTGVVDYYVTVSDSSDIDFGNLILKSTNSIDKSYSFDVLEYVSKETESVILYFTVSAVYKNEDLTFFVGPRADVPDTALVKID